MKVYAFCRAWRCSFAGGDGLLFQLSILDHDESFVGVRWVSHYDIELGLNDDRPNHDNDHGDGDDIRVLLLTPCASLPFHFILIVLMYVHSLTDRTLD